MKSGSPAAPAPAERASAARAALLEDGAILCLRFGAGVPVLDMARAAARGGLRVLEVTLTTPGALEVIRALSSEDVLVGAGTVLTTEDAAAVARAGGRFALSPVFDPQVFDAARAQGLLAIPGAATPTEVYAAHRHGAGLVKIFPAGALGGPDYLRAVRGPLPDVGLIPTSGPTAENLADYFDSGAAAVGIGRDVFGEGFTQASVEEAAARVRRAIDRR